MHFFKEFEKLYSNKLGKKYIYYFYGYLSIAACIIYLKVQNCESNMAAKIAYLSLFKEFERLSNCNLLIFYLYDYNSCLLIVVSIIIFKTAFAQFFKEFERLYSNKLESGIFIIFTVVYSFWYLASNQIYN